MKLPYTLPLTDWHTPASEYPTEEQGSARIIRKPQSKGYYRLYGLQDNLFYQVKRPIPITELQIKEGKRWKTWMVDDPPSYYSMQKLAAEARGKVLTTGLGLGLIVHELAKNPAVENTVVVERNPDVIGMMMPLMPQGAIFPVLADFYAFVVSGAGYQWTNTKWDTIIVDLWVSHSAAERQRIAYQEVLPLGLRLKEKHPSASISFHGFPEFSDTQVISKETMDLIVKLKPYA